MRRLALALSLAASLAIAPHAAAQVPPSTGMPTQDIVPEPNSGHPPTEAGDRGGALQLLIPGVMVLAVAGGVLHLRRQSRRARHPDASNASQAAVPSMKPDR